MKIIKVGTGLRFFKKEQGLTYKEIGIRLNVDYVASVQRMADSHAANTTTVERLAHAFGVTPAEFIDKCTVESDES